MNAGMKCIAAVAALSFLASLVAARLAMAQAACANASGTWTGGAATTLSISQYGNVIGNAILNVPPGSGCAQTMQYQGTGSWSDGSVTMNLGIPLNGIAPPGCASTISLSGTIRGSGCDELSGTWINDIKNGGFFSFAEPVYIPTESSVATNTWAVPDPLPANPVVAREDDVPTIGVFEQTLSGNIPNFGGRTITETFPDPNADSCWFERSAYPKFIPQAAPSFVLDVQSNNQYQDDIGSPADRIDYYRYFQRAPCDFATTQVMTISTDSGSKSYATKSLDIHIDPVTITSTRLTGVTQTKAWGETQAQWAAHRTAMQSLQIWLITHGL